MLSSSRTEETILDYFALGLLIFVGLVLFYGIIVIHVIPCEIAKHRNHPHQDSIHTAGWVSMFTLHALWPFLWIWAMLYRDDRGWGFGDGSSPQNSVVCLEQQIADCNSVSNGWNGGQSCPSSEVQSAPVRESEPWTFCLHSPMPQWLSRCPRFFASR